MPKLSDTAIRAAKPREKAYKLYDADGLFIVITPSGGRWWRQRYKYAGREQLLSLGVYPQIGLSTAREHGAAVRKKVANGIDPSADRKTRKAAQRGSEANTFKAVATAWHTKFKPQWSAKHANRILTRLEDNVFPWIGRKAIKDVTEDDLLKIIDRIAERGAYDLARRMLQVLKKIFKAHRSLIVVNPAVDIEPKDLLPRIKVKHRAAIKDPHQFGALLRAIAGYEGSFVVKCALQLMYLTFVRSSELRYAEWSEFELDGTDPMWRIPAARMKMEGESHLVPLSMQSVAVLREIRPLTGADGKGKVFPGVRNVARPLSENTVNSALRTMGFAKEQHTGHGFRTTASTFLNEQQWNPDAIELQLAHMERDETRESYNAATHLPLRRKMMQAWADYCDELREGDR